MQLEERGIKIILQKLAKSAKDRLLSYSVLSRVFAFFAAFCSVFIQKQKNGNCPATSLIEE